MVKKTFGRRQRRTVSVTVGRLTAWAVVIVKVGRHVAVDCGQVFLVYEIVEMFDNESLLNEFGVVRCKRAFRVITTSAQNPLARPPKCRKSHFFFGFVDGFFGGFGAG